MNQRIPLDRIRTAWLRFLNRDGFDSCARCLYFCARYSCCFSELLKALGLLHSDNLKFPRIIFFWFFVKIKSRFLDLFCLNTSWPCSGQCFCSNKNASFFNNVALCAIRESDIILQFTFQTVGLGHKRTVLSCPACALLLVAFTARQILRVLNAGYIIMAASANDHRSQGCLPSFSTSSKVSWI